MRHDEYAEHVIDFTGEMTKVTEVKNHDYSVGEDAMSNFKMISSLLGGDPITPRMVWAVLFGKHLSAVINHMVQGKSLKDETIHGRFIDLANYAMLGDALDADLALPPENAAEEPEYDIPRIVRLLKAAREQVRLGSRQGCADTLTTVLQLVKCYAHDGSENPDVPLHDDPETLPHGDGSGRPHDGEPVGGPDARPDPTGVAAGAKHFRGY